MAGGEDGGDVARLPAAIELRVGASAVQLVGNLFQFPTRIPPGPHLPEDGLLGGVALALAWLPCP